MRFRLRSLLIALALLLGGVGAVAQQPAPPPGAGLSQQQFDQLVDSIARAVREQLARDGADRPASPAAPAPATPAAARGLGEPAPMGELSSSGLFDRFLAVMRAAPGVWPDVSATIAHLVGTPEERGGILLLLVRVAIIVALIAIGVAALRRVESRLRAMAFDGGGPYGRRTRVLIAVGLDILHRALPIIFVYALLEFWFRADVLQQRLLLRTLATLAFWYLLTFPVEAALRPSHPGLRLVRFDDATARLAAIHLAGILLAGTATIHYLQMLIHNGTAIPSAQFLALLIAAVVGIWVVIAIRAVRASERRAAPGPRRAWPFAVGALAGVVWLSWVIGVLNVDLAHFDALVWSVIVVASAWVVDATIGLAIGRQVDPDARVQWWRDIGVLRLLRRVVRVAAFVVIGILVIQTWVVELFNLVSDERWRHIKSGLAEAGLILVIGYLAWEALRIVIDRKLARAAPGLGPAASDDEAAQAGSRFQTMLPVIRIFAGIAIGAVAVLFALAQLGVNIAPLIAGASIFGLAISFGSQTLVRDIVSGIFFMADDAFRIGEYVDTGKLKGTVEGISMRSIKLRHQNGQIHTVPFGQIQSVTNFSRDWATIKFNLRLARDTDLEKVRKIAKKVGVAMLEDPEFKPEFLQPLKMQGVADIEPTALVVRFKFTVRPLKPSWVQREAVKRLLFAFRDGGIDFASGAVTVQTVGGFADLPAAAAAAAQPTPAQAAGG